MSYCKLIAWKVIWERVKVAHLCASVRVRRGVFRGVSPSVRLPWKCNQLRKVSSTPRLTIIEVKLRTTFFLSCPSLPSAKYLFMAPFRCCSFSASTERSKRVSLLTTARALSYRILDLSYAYKHTQSHTNIAHSHTPEICPFVSAFQGALELPLALRPAKRSADRPPIRCYF